ncbi:GntR family transcriptional regulator [Streptomyces sp. DSM 44917]|uniref:GntR family transcriptional regulator n=1 Tax=Streptomyces boetiae TaxID=3075541 RepID=A0ABU2LCU1_9ACTN|nr:GntR family transcriptional regulator [Streptomyces sp. DSM 44917]MDT0309073.1 GntR family transcriptional regulator [Streptomyces sp. DSM 44917]
MAKLKYEQIADSLRERITNGEFAPGQLLPSGRDLCEQWGVSRATVVKAMDVLRADGVVVARQGSGFTVVEVPVARPAGRRGRSARALGAHPFRRLGRPTMAQPPEHVAEALELRSGDVALRRDRLVLLDDGSPLTLVIAWFPPDIAKACSRLAGEAPLAEGTTAYVARTTGRSPVRGTDVCTVRLATSEEAEVLGLSTPAAVAVVLHHAVDADGRPLVCEEGVTPGATWEFTDSYPMGS